MTAKKSTLKILFLAVVRSEHRIDMLNVKSIGKEHLNVFITEPFFFLGSSKEAQKQPPEVFYKKLFLKIRQYLQENTCTGVPATLLKRDSNAGVFLLILRIF